MIKYKDKEKPKEIGLFGLGQRQKTNLDLGLDVFDGVGGLHLEGDGFARKGFDENLHFDSCKKLKEVKIKYSSGKTWKD